MWLHEKELFNSVSLRSFTLSLNQQLEKADTKILLTKKIFLKQKDTLLCNKHGKNQKPSPLKNFLNREIPFEKVE